MQRVTKLAVVVATFVALFPAGAQAAFPGANGKIAFNGVNTIDPDGSNPSSLGGDGAYPSWSVDGRRILYVFPNVCTAPGREQYLCHSVWTMNADGSAKTKVPNIEVPWYEILGAANSPDGSTIAYAQDAGDGDHGLFLINPDGTGKRDLLTEAGHSGSFPDWSPAGIHSAELNRDHTSLIAFTRAGPIGTPAYSEQIFTIDPDTAEPFQLTSTGNSTRPSWSPDASKIVFSSDRDGNGEIYVMDAFGRNQTRLTFNAAHDTSPVFSPDGAKIAFSSGRGPTGIWVMDADGSNPTFLTAGASPDWQPLGAFDPYPRPGGGTPLRVPLVPAYHVCFTAPNAEHAPPLALPSCSPPRLDSTLTTTTTGTQSAYARLEAQPGDPTTTADEADIAITLQASAVKRASDGSDYSGPAFFRTGAIRISDRSNGYGGVAATTQDTDLELPVACGAGNCNLNTTLDTLLPGFAKEGKRMVAATPNVRLFDAGPDGSITPSVGSCPPDCGTSDEQPYLRQGVFLP